MARTKQRYEPWEIRDFSAGVVEKLNDNILPDNAAHECSNFISSRLGGLAKRKGQQRLNEIPLPAMIQGLHPYYSRITHTRRLIAVSQGIGYLWNGNEFEVLTFEGAESLLGDPSFPLIGTHMWGETMFNHPEGIFPLDPSAPVLFEDAVNEVVAMNGVNPPWKWDGAVVSFLEHAPQKGRYPILHKEKLFCVDADDPSTVVWSDTFAMESWPVINYWDVRKGDGDHITCMIHFLGDLLIFKNRSMHALKGTSLDDFSMNEITSSVGCVGPRAAVVHDLKVFFVSEYGLYATNGMNVLNISEMVIPDTWERVNKRYLHRATVTTWNDMVWMALPIDGSHINNFVLIYDSKKQAFWPMHGMGVSCYCYYNDGTGDGVRLYGGSHTNGHVLIQDQGYSDWGNPIHAYWRGKYFDMNAPEVEKKARQVFVQDSPETDCKVDVTVSTDYGEYGNLIPHREEGLTREYRLELDSNRFRYISPMFKHEGTEPCEVRGIAIPFKPKTKMKVREV